MDIAKFRQKPALGIIRGTTIDNIEPLIEQVISAGLETIEIAMNTRGAAEQIKLAVKTARGRLTVGAGTVMTPRLLRTALDAGAAFIVMPTLVKEVVQTCVKEKIPVFPGALTPQEIYNVWSAGASMVKVFPSGMFGPKYLKEIKAPFNDIQLMACGGVNPENVKEYFSCGASAIAFGGGVFKQELLDKKNYSAIGDSIKAILDNLPASKTTKGLNKGAI